MHLSSKFVTSAHYQGFENLVREVFEIRKSKVLNEAFWVLFRPRKIVMLVARMKETELGPPLGRCSFGRWRKRCDGYSKADLRGRNLEHEMHETGGLWCGDSGSLFLLLLNLFLWWAFDQSNCLMQLSTYFVVIIIIVLLLCLFLLLLYFTPRHFLFTQTSSN